MMGLKGCTLGGLMGFFVLLTAATGVSGQELYLSGQNVQPVFEGWERNSDGTFDLVFGYLNRNYTEEPYIPVGANNSFLPGPADRGQPTHFYPRRQSFVFKVTVPADWGEQELIWKMTHNGRTSQAVGSVGDSNWEVDEGVWKANRGSGIFGRTGKEFKPNERPSIKVLGTEATTVTLSDALTLTVSVSDDGQPGRREDLLPRKPPSSTEVPIRTPGIPERSGRTGPNTQDMVSARAAYESGLAVSWIHYRGPGSVTFEPRVTGITREDDTLAGRAVTSVRFSVPGTYVIRALADDGIFTIPADVTVTVKDTGSSHNR